MGAPFVVAVSRDETHRFSKVPREAIELVAGLGVRGDAHAGTRVQHRSRVRRDPDQPNLRQVHLIQDDLVEVLLTEEQIQTRLGELAAEVWLSDVAFSIEKKEDAS
mgnify:CR=1 FL=1